MRVRVLPQGRWRRLALAAVFVAVGLQGGLAGASTAARADAQCPWTDASLTPEKRAKLLLAAMTLDDKIELVHQDEFWTHYGAAGYIAGNPAFCLPDLVLNDGPAGVGDLQPGTTPFPAPIARAASWDRALQTEFGRALGWEARHKGDNVMLAPGFNIARTPLNGRNFEYMGEDPYLAGQGAAAEVSGIQSQNVIATVKHFAANNQEIDRMSVSADADERTLHEIYLAPFETAVKQGGAGSVMCAYNKINGIYACEQPTLLTDYLKREFGFTGFVMSDWGGTHSTVESALAGLDMEMSIGPGTFFAEPLKQAVQNGEVPMSRLDDMVLRILRTMFRVGLFDHPLPAQPDAFAAIVSTPEHVRLARELAEEGTVLLKNEDGILPLEGTGKTIALIGQAAGQHGAEMVYGGGGSSHVPEFGVAPNVVSPLQGIQQTALAKGDRVIYADGTVVEDAVAAATVADVAIVFANDAEGEGSDRPDLQLTGGFCTLFGCLRYPTSQDALISAVAQANPDTAVVLNTGGPVLMPWLDEVKGVVEAWYPGVEDGNAIAAILFGEVNPSGKLPQTFPRAQSDLPTRTPEQYPGMNGHATYSEGLLVGYRWFDEQGIEPLFAFGHGLSYTSFGYSKLTVRRRGNGAEVGFTLTNTGDRAGAEVAQVYVGFPNSAGEPPRQLKGFTKVFLEPGEGGAVKVDLDPRAFAYWKISRHAWVVARGTYDILVGSSSRDIRLRGKLSLPGGTLR